MAQAVPLVTRADPTVGGRTLTEGYLSQPIVMTHAAWGDWRGIATLNFEGLTLQRGELNTGGYGEGYVDRRHPHSYVHELLAGWDRGDSTRWATSVFAGRGFIPFGSDDPMVRPFVKYPINHHLSQILEREEVVGAARYGPLIGELATFNGDEPIGPGTAPAYKRFGDSWSTRLTLLPLTDLELSGSFAKVASPEVRAGAGLDAHKTSVVARYDRESPISRVYGLAEWARTNELNAGDLVTQLSSFLAEGALCRYGVIVGGRVERTDRPEEEVTLDPFRSIRPATDLHNLGVSRWTTFTGSLISPKIGADWISGRPFVEVERIAAAAGSPPGLFSAVGRYGASQMWMLSAGVRLSAGSMRDMRMGRYGAAVPPTSSMESMSSMAGMHHGMTHQPSADQCTQ
jgi:hypothetical protein